LTVGYILFEKHVGFRSKMTFFTVLRAAGETGAMQEWLQLDEGNPTFQLLVFSNKGFTVDFFLFSSPLLISLNFSIYLCSGFFTLLH
jgi:hypothetical protein